MMGLFVRQFELEQFVLGRLLADNFKIDAARLAIEPEDFIDSAHGAIFATITALATAGRPVTMLAVAAAMPQDIIEEFGGKMYIYQLVAGLPQ